MPEPSKVVHVSTWKEFRGLAIALRPEFVAYTVQNALLCKPPMGLRLVFSKDNIQYVFLDFAHGGTFTKTRLPVHTHTSGVAYFNEEELREFVKSELNRRDTAIISFEILGY